MIESKEKDSIYQERIVCFIDILGFQSYVNDSINIDLSTKTENIKNIQDV